MCKATIEKSANSVDGVLEATWNKEAKKATIFYDDTKTDAITIHKAIAKSGYDTDQVKANENAYNNLAGCCQYDKEMKISEKKANKECCGGAKKSCTTKEKQNK